MANLILLTDKKIFTELTIATVAVYLQCRGIPIGKGSCRKKDGLIIFNFCRCDEYIYRSYGVRFAEGVDKRGCQTIEFCEVEDAYGEQTIRVLKSFECEDIFSFAREFDSQNWDVALEKPADDFWSYYEKECLSSLMFIGLRDGEIIDVDLLNK